MENQGSSEEKNEKQQQTEELIPIHTTIILDGISMEKIKSGESEIISFSVKGSYTHPYKTLPSGVENQVSDYETAYSEILEALEKEFEVFPDCCKEHRKLALEEWFNKENFKEVPRLTADKIFYTYNHLLNFIKEKNWEQEIKDYLEYTLESFGHFPSMLGGPVFFNHYLNQVEHILSLMEKSEEYCFPVKIKVIREYIEQKITPVEKASDTDLNLLLKTYNRWYEIFPFDLSYLQPLKEKFSKSIPVFTSSHTNTYSGRTAFTPTTPNDLVNLLLKTTDNLLREFNTLYLYKNSLITNYSRLKLELIIKERELQLQKGYLVTNEEETAGYYQILERWFQDEVNFVSHISSLFTEETQNKEEFQSFDQETEELKKQENLFWKGIPMKVVVEHFIKLTTHKNKRKEPYLTQSQFLHFIKRAFLKDTSVEKQTLDISNSENGAVIKLFYLFFDLAVAGYGEKSKNERYIQLVVDNFTNWDSFSKVKSLFRKDKSVKIW